MFIDGLFEAAGQKLHISNSYKQQLCNGRKPFSVGLKEPLRNRDNLQALTDFFMREIANTSVVNVIAAFGIPEKDQPDKGALCAALAHQTKLMIDSDEEDVEDILTVQYQNLKDGDAGNQVETMRPLYPGDSVYMRSSFRPIYTVEIDQIFEHAWVFDNAGTQIWVGRRLYLSNHNEIRPRAESNYVDIPDTPPNKGVVVSVRIDPRSFEKKSECKWIMVDRDGNDCFPNSSQFVIIVDVTFHTGN